jgi:hypothetical protein
MNKLYGNDRQKIIGLKKVLNQLLKKTGIGCNVAHIIYSPGHCFARPPSLRLRRKEGKKVKLKV